MPFARVGAMPQTETTSKQYNNNVGNKGSKSRPKGITMEDLKKQTALRLAQEQNQGNIIDPAVQQPTPDIPVTRQPVPPLPHHQQQGVCARVDGYTDTSIYNQQYASRQRQQQHPMMMPMAPPRPPLMYVSDQHQSAPPPPPPQNSSLVNQHPGGYAATSYSYSSKVSHKGYGSSSNYPQDPQRMAHMVPQSGPGTVSTSQPINTRPASVPNAVKPKLPHGLTVHELKEMTKARLQAEAAEKHDVDVHRERGISPLDFEGSPVGEVREHVVAQDRNGQNTSGFPRNVYSPSFRNIPRTDTWDSASVASHVSISFSENLGSESASDTGFNNGVNRMRSYTVPSLPSADVNVSRESYTYPVSANASPGHVAPPNFDAAVGGNRRRAATLSPCTGSIFENRPHHGSLRGDRLHLPSFSNENDSTAPIQARQRDYSPVLEQLGFDGSLLSGCLNSSMFGSSLSDFHSTSSTSEGLLRETPCSEARVPAPPGFVSSEHSRSAHSQKRATAFTRIGSVETVEESFLGSKNPWDTNDRPRLATVDNLCSDLGSILNLSGSDRSDRERANTYTFGSGFTAAASNNNYINDAFVSKEQDSFQY